MRRVNARASALVKGGMRIVAALLLTITVSQSVAPAGVTRVPVDITNNHVYVKVLAGERPLDFVLDTGAGRSPLDLGVATSLGASITKAHEVRGAGAGTAAGGAIASRKITVAGTPIEVDVTTTVDFSMLTAREGRAIQGILGGDFIRRFVVAIDYVNNEIRLYDRRGFKYDGPGTSVPLSFGDGHPIIDATITLAENETVKGRFVVDVGSAAALSLVKTFVDRHRLRERIGPTLRRRGGGGVGGPVEAEFGRVGSLNIGGLKLAAPITSLHGDAAGVFTANPHWDGNIGGDILRRFTVLLDYERKRMILEPHARTSEPFEADMSGAALMLGASPNELLVDLLLAGAPAAEAGLLTGDVVVAIDDQPVHARTLVELRPRLRREGQTVRLTVLRAGERQVVTFTTRRLV